MRSLRRRWVAVLALGAFVFACGEDVLSPTTETPDGGKGLTEQDASVSEDAASDDATSNDGASDDASSDGSSDASNDAPPDGPIDAGLDAMLEDGGSPLLRPFVGVWEGTGVDTGTWSILYAITPNADGRSYGIASYPTLGCGGSLRHIGEDAGIDAGAGDAGSRLILREKIGGTGIFCLNDVDMVLALLPNDTIAARFFDVNTHAQIGTGTLRRVSEADGGGDDRLGVWRDPADAGSNYHPMMAAIVRNGSAGPARGVYLVPSTTGKACSGIWEMTATNHGDMFVSERSPDGGPACPALGNAVLRRTDAGTLQYGPNDGGTTGALTLEKL